jgi:hypothetical protein
VRRKTVRRRTAARVAAEPGRRLTYEDFRTGLTFRDVRQMLWVHSDDPREWKYKRRHTVLGLWRSIKLGLWDRYLAENDR